MQFDARHRGEILDGTVTLTFRRWKRRQVVAGRRYRTSLGIVEVDSVDVIEPDAIPDAITDDDVRRAGSGSLVELLDQLVGDPSLPLYRVAFHVVHEADPRAVLAAGAELSDADRAEIDLRLDRLDRAAKHGPWTRTMLDLIAAHPRTRAADLAAMAGRQTAPFKLDVRKLKALGLTLSLEVGYELSPRGRAYLGRAR